MAISLGTLSLFLYGVVRTPMELNGFCFAVNSRAYYGIGSKCQPAMRFSTPEPPLNSKPAIGREQLAFHWRHSPAICVILGRSVSYCK